MKKTFLLSDYKRVNVELKKVGSFYKVFIDGNLYYESANELFAIQRFNAI